MEGVVQKFWKTVWHKDWTFLYFPANFEKIISWNSAAIGVEATRRTRENTRSDIARSRISPAVRFPLNKEMVIENQLPSSLVGMRQVYDGVQANGWVGQSRCYQKNDKVRLARSEYARALAEKKNLIKKVKRVKNANELL